VSFRWVYRSDPKTVSGSSEGFRTQDAAEAFMGAEFQRLLDAGHIAASLMDGEDELYTMKLTADQ
jgi:hypothetical protein